MGKKPSAAADPACARRRGYRRLAFGLGAVAAAAGAALLVWGGSLMAGRAGHAALDRAVGELLADARIPGAVVATGWIGHEPTIRAIGVADRESGAEISTSARFRLASLSKPVTAAAIAALVGEGRLGLDERLVDILPDFRGAADPRFPGITVRHLLSHSAGWDRGVSGDPMFMDLGSIGATTAGASMPERSCRDIALIIASRPLDFGPGERAAYSNLGYCFLALVLEKRTGMPYGKAVERLLDGSIDGFSLTASDIDVTQHGAPDTEGQGGSSANDAAGGWIASAEAYFRFLKTPLHPETRDPPDFYGSDASFYGLGWRVWPGRDCPDLTHYGAMPGAFSVVVRARSGQAMVGLFNARPPDDWAAFAKLVNAACAEFRHAG